MMAIATLPAQALLPEVEVNVNPNLELFAVLYILAFNGSDPFIYAPQEYIQDVLTYFAPYKDHEAVEFIRRVADKSLPANVREYLIMKFSDRLVFLNYLPNETELGELEKLADFARKSNFMAFYNAHKNEYVKMSSKLERILECASNEYEKLFGRTYSFRAEVSYSLKIHPHRLIRNQTIYYIGEAYYHSNFSFYERALAMTHLFAWPFVEDLVNKNHENFENLSYYLGAVRNKLPLPSYTASSYFKQVFAEAVSEHVALKCGIPDDYIEMRRLSFSYMMFPLENIFEGIQELGNGTLYLHIQKITEDMKRWATPKNISRLYERSVPVVGFHFVSRSLYTGTIIIVYGTQNPDKSGTEADKETAYAVKRRFERELKMMYGYSPRIEVKADKDLTEDDLKQNLILIGGPVANKITAQLNDNLPIKFTFNGSWTIVRNSTAVGTIKSFRIASGNITKVYPGLNALKDAYGFMEILKNPWNRNNYILVIAGVDRYGTKNVSYFPWRQSYAIESDSYIEVGFYFMAE
ncbi:hypothetical protein A3L04_00625 [Thermococcus chitonophagus]|uniref:S-layer protein outer domain-containing protein n=2 Tax=Thermococcus chitonophagus TaxID=54262 RepID=A0A160VQ18_9EURY|nr:hypothetical protein A3L04_00625 [Thermococcus chitonophagus]CUX76895.1 hypothetical protein CHITON_0116 [Thermococcus chitonophagus]